MVDSVWVVWVDGIPPGKGKVCGIVLDDDDILIDLLRVLSIELYRPF